MDHSLNVKPVNRYKVKPNEEKEFRDIEFGTNLQNLQAEYLNVYEGIQSDIVSSSTFDENSDIRTTYLDKIVQVESQNKLKAEESFPISENGYTLGRLLDGMKCQLLLDTGASESLCQNHSLCAVSHYIPYQNLQLAYKGYKGELDNVSVYCSSIPVIIEVHGHQFKIYTLVSKIHENVDLVLGIKNVFELEGVINSRDCRFEFLNRSVPIYPEKELILKPNE